ncbi:MAG: flagellar basal body-associated FliL family protein [Rhodocyclaceae bacterium]|nr:flagellar basal body-associated FliL family protein [Rhodocyclaceae bacterium]
MSKPAAKPDAEGEEKPKKGKKLLIIILVVVLLLVIAGGAAAFLLLKNKHADEDEGASHAAEAPAKIKVDLSQPPTFVNLEPFTVNLAPAEGDHYLQVMLVLKVVDQQVADQMAAYMPEIRHEINLVLSSRLPSEVATVPGRENLADEIMERTNYVLGFEKPRDDRRRHDTGPWGPVLSVLFNSFIVQ